MKTLLIIAGVWFVAALIVLGIFYLISIPTSEYFEDFENDEDLFV